MRKRKIDVVVLSDVHLGTSGSNANDLICYLKSIQPNILIINGDFIDGWNFKKKYFPSSHIEVIRRVLKMGKKGTKVFYLTGNHDDFLRSYHGFVLGNFHILDQLRLTLNGESHWFFHGDIFDISIQGKMKYIAQFGGKAYDWLIRLNRNTNRILEFFGRDKMSFSKKVKQSVKLAVRWINDFERLAADLAIQEGVSVVCCGHIHTPSIKKYANEKGEILYLNSGDWVESNSALEYNNGQWTISNYWNLGKLQNEVEETTFSDDFVEELELAMFGNFNRSL